MNPAHSSYTLQRQLLAALSLLTLFALACGDDDQPLADSGARDAATSADATVMDASVPPACGAPGRSGVTPCEVSVAGTCAAGQYCDTTMLTCVPGCTDDTNCGPNDRCVRMAGSSVGACAACPSCGDGVCQGDETPSSCPADCGASSVCGDGVCQPTESVTSCPGDCATAVCGDDVCQPTESATSCPGDCAAAVCGDDVCQPTESMTSCPGDCSRTPFEACIRACEGQPMCGGAPGLVDACRAACGEASAVDQAAYGACWNDDCSLFASCLRLECIGDAQCSAGTCIDGTCCGNGVCDPVFEDSTICPADCTQDFLAECYEECDGFAFFGCGVGCRAACTTSTPERRTLFLECGNPTLCNFDECLPLL